LVAFLERKRLFTAMVLDALIADRCFRRSGNQRARFAAIRHALARIDAIGGHKRCAIILGDALGVGLRLGRYERHHHGNHGCDKNLLHDFEFYSMAWRMDLKMKKYQRVRWEKIA
jgi:hypothetical protein